MGSPTTNYGWTKPTVGNDDDAWGGQLNVDLDGIDSTVKSVSNVANAALPLSGGTLTGPLVYAADPTVPLGGATKQYVDGARLGDNRIINGDMRIDQRNNGASGTAAPAYTVDRWLYNGTQANMGSWVRAGLAPSGFSASLRFVSSSAYTLTTNDIFRFVQQIEADMVTDFAWGTANAQPVTLSFWVYSTLTGTFGGSIYNYSAASRSYLFTYSIPAASTWTKITIVVPGDTAGAWTMSGNSGAISLQFSLGAGSGVSGPANVWGPFYQAPTGAVSVVSTNGGQFNITGVKLEIGSVATPFNRQSLTKSLADCQRYYQTGLFYFINGASAAASAAAATSVSLPVSMRATPTVTVQTNTNSNLGAPTLTGNTQNAWLNAAVTASGVYTINTAYIANAEL